MRIVCDKMYPIGIQRDATAMAYASVRKRTWQTKDGPKTAWIADYFDQDGVRRQKTFSTRGAAKDWLPKTHQEIKQGTHVPDSTAAALREAADAWIKRGEAEGLEASTLRQRRLHVAHILALLDGDTKLSRYSVAKLEAFRDELLLRQSRAMARKIIVSLRAIFKQAKAAHLANAELTVKVGGRHQRKLKVGVDIPLPGEVKAVIEATADDPKARSLACLAGFAGLRASELRGLAWPNVKLDQHKVTIEERADELGALGSPKSDASKRTIGLNATTVQALKAWKLAQPPIVSKGEDGQEIRRPRTLVFGTATDRPDGLANIRRRLLGPAMVKAGVALRALDSKGKPVKDKDGNPVMRPKYTGLHCLRHFAISSWLKTCGGDFKAVQARAGHATLALTLDTYGHLLDVNDGDQIAAAERLVLG
jgi:integrase